MGGGGVLTWVIVARCFFSSERIFQESSPNFPTINCLRLKLILSDNHIYLLILND